MWVEFSERGCCQGMSLTRICRLSRELFVASQTRATFSWMTTGCKVFISRMGKGGTWGAVWEVHAIV